jgi:hypothetical protein
MNVFALPEYCLLPLSRQLIFYVHRYSSAVSPQNRGSAFMISGKSVAIAVLFCFCAVFISLAQQDPKPWEKYGLSQTEWKMIQDDKIPIAKVQELLSAGISISEYIEKPWVKYHFFEKSYIEKRRSGLSAYDIELESTSDRSGWKNDNKSVFTSEANVFSGNKEVLLSFILPGYQQQRLEHKWRGRIMTTLAVGSIAGCFLASLAEVHFEGTPLFVVLVPDMFWSMIDFKFTRDKNKE